MWALIDNYDSFSYILLDYLLQTGNECVVYRNDEITVGKLRQLNPERIIISPGPETPLQAGNCMEIIKAFHTTTPILGICLGHQALGMFYGAKLERAPYPMHGKTSFIKHESHPVFNGMNAPVEVMRYHSLVITKTESTELRAFAWSEDDHQIMAMEHDRFPSLGIQFHPESVGTPGGLTMLKNWAEMYR